VVGGEGGGSKYRCGKRRGWLGPQTREYVDWRWYVQ
jgi:hypothetical protein